MARRRNDEVDSMIADMTDQMMDDADRASSLERERGATPARYRAPAGRSRAPARSVRTPAPRTLRTPAPRTVRTPAPRTVRTPGRPIGTPIPPRRATGRKTNSSLAFTPRLHVEDKLLEFTIAVYDCQFNYEGTYFYQMTVVSPGASKREHQSVLHWSEANGEKLEPGPVASTEQLQVFSPLDNADFRLNRFKFVLPRGFFNTEKSDEMYLLLEVFRVDGRPQPQKAGECKCPIFPRPPPYDLYARPLEPIYVQSGLLTIVSTTVRKSQPGNFRHVGRTRYRCRLRELNDPSEAVKSRPTEEAAPDRNPPRSRLDQDSYRDWEPAYDDWPEQPSGRPDQRPYVRPADQRPAVRPANTTYQRPESPTRNEPLPRPKTPVETDDPVDPDYPNGYRARTPARAQPRNSSPPLTTARTPASRRDPNRNQPGKRIPVAQDYGYESAVPELPFGRATEAEGAGNQGQSGPVGEEWPRQPTPSLSLIQLQPKTGAFPVTSAAIVSKNKTPVNLNTETYVSRIGNELITVMVYAASGVPLKPDGNTPSPYVILKTKTIDDAGGSGTATKRCENTQYPRWFERLTVEVDERTSDNEMIIINLADANTREILVSYKMSVSLLKPFHNYYVDLFMPSRGSKNGSHLFARITRKISRLPETTSDFSGLEVAVLGLRQRNLVYRNADLGSALIAVARVVPDYAAYREDIPARRVNELPINVVEFPSPHPSSFFLQTNAANVLATRASDSSPPSWYDALLFSEPRDLSTMFMPNAALVIEYYSFPPTHARSTHPSWTLMNRVGYSVVPLDHALYERLREEASINGLYMEVPVQGNDMRVQRATNSGRTVKKLPSVDLVLRLHHDLRPSPFSGTINVPALPTYPPKSGPAPAVEQRYVENGLWPHNAEVQQQTDPLPKEVRAVQTDRPPQTPISPVSTAPPNVRTTPVPAVNTQQQQQKPPPQQQQQQPNRPTLRGVSQAAVASNRLDRSPIRTERGTQVRPTDIPPPKNQTSLNSELRRHEPLPPETPNRPGLTTALRKHEPLPPDTPQGPGLATALRRHEPPPPESPTELPPRRGLVSTIKETPRRPLRRPRRCRCRHPPTPPPERPSMAEANTQTGLPPRRGQNDLRTRRTPNGHPTNVSTDSGVPNDTGEKSPVPRLLRVEYRYPPRPRVDPYAMPGWPYKHEADAVSYDYLTGNPDKYVHLQRIGPPTKRYMGPLPGKEDKELQADAAFVDIDDHEHHVHRHPPPPRRLPPPPLPHRHRHRHRHYDDDSYDDDDDYDSELDDEYDDYDDEEDEEDQNVPEKPPGQKPGANQAPADKEPQKQPQRDPQRQPQREPQREPQRQPQREPPQQSGPRGNAPQPQAQPQGRQQAQPQGRQQPQPQGRQQPQPQGRQQAQTQGNQPAQGPANQNQPAQAAPPKVLERPTKYPKSYYNYSEPQKSRLRDMHRDLETLRGRIAELEQTKRSLADELRWQQEASPGELDDTMDANDMNRNDLEFRYEAMLEQYKKTREQLDNYKQKASRLYETLQDKEGEPKANEKEMTRLTQATRTQSDMVNKLQSRIAREQKLEELIRKQERVIERMEKIVERRPDVHRNNLHNRNNKALYDILTEENDAIHNQIYELQDNLNGDYNNMADGAEKDKLRDRLDRAQTKIEELEQQLVNQAEIWTRKYPEEPL